MSDDPLRDARRRERVRLACDIIGLACVAGVGYVLWLWLGLLLTGLGLFALSWRLENKR